MAKQRPSDRRRNRPHSQSDRRQRVEGTEMLEGPFSHCVTHTTQWEPRVEGFCCLLLDAPVKRGGRGSRATPVIHRPPSSLAFESQGEMDRLFDAIKKHDQSFGLFLQVQFVACVLSFSVSSVGSSMSQAFERLRGMHRGFKANGCTISQTQTDIEGDMMILGVCEG